MINHRIRSMPVLDRRQQLAGIIPREDVVRAGLRGQLFERVGPRLMA
jgi:CBS-domain-containing membrane protein